MEKARKRFANLQDELRKVHPSDEKYRVNISSYQFPSLSLTLLRIAPDNMFLSHTNCVSYNLLFFYIFLQEIQNKILLEYKENNNNSSFQDKKKR